MRLDCEGGGIIRSALIKPPQSKEGVVMVPLTLLTNKASREQFGRRRRSKIVSMKAQVVLAAIAFTSTLVNATQVPPYFPDAVVALGSARPLVSGPPCAVQWVTEGTGFLYGYLVKGDPDPTKRMYAVYLVTNRHVIEDHATTQAISRLQQAQSAQSGENCGTTFTAEGMISVRMNPLNSSLQGRKFDLPVKDWSYHPTKDVDIAAILLDPQSLKTEGLQDMFFANDTVVANKEKLKAKGVSAGDGVFVLGFPMNLAGIQRNYVIVRHGCIARISEMLDGTSPSYLVDAFIFPGNSGSPVILKAELSSISGTPAQTRAELVGVVKSYIPYIDVAFSPQTKSERITFEENSGLAEVLPADYIDEAIKAWSGSRSQLKQ